MVPIERLACIGDGRFAQLRGALCFAFEQPQLFILVETNADEIIAAHRQFAAILIAKTTYGHAEAKMFFDKFGREYLAEIARLRRHRPLDMIATRQALIELLETQSPAR